ncbi:MAG TPA: HNH endonuclease [Desulfobacteria bacterium]|nr:HNH endonuclease [Desulfobacteria bacterium]
MSFPNPVKQEARKKAAFQCCICKKSDLSLEVHHIIPEGQGGSDDLDNAVLLCSSCHSNYGANPEKRTMIREMRDFWYETVEKMYTPASISMITDLYMKVDQIQQDQSMKVDQIQQDQSNMSADVSELRGKLKEFVNHSIDELEITPGTAISTVSRFVNASASQSPDCCEECGFRFVIPPESNQCPNCGAHIAKNHSSPLRSIYC